MAASWVIVVASVIWPGSAFGGPVDTSSMSPIAWPFAISGSITRPRIPS